MSGDDEISKILSELREGMSLEKCKKCGCMRDTLENLSSVLSDLRSDELAELRKHVEQWLSQLQPREYECIGCKHCFPAVVSNLFYQRFPDAGQPRFLTCGFETKKETWPPVPGEYFVLGEGAGFPVAVSTLASAGLAEKLAEIRPEGLAIVGKTETENIGIDKVIKNTISNPSLRFLILSGKEPEGHRSGGTLLAAWKNGVDENMKVISAPGKNPVLKNITKGELEAFRKQVELIDMIGCEDIEKVLERIRTCSVRKPPVKKLLTKPLEQVSLSCSCACKECAEVVEPHGVTVPVISENGIGFGAGTHAVSCAPVILADEPENVKMDRSGYFVIIPQPSKKIISVEQYSYDHSHLRTIEGKDARSIYLMIIRNGWVSELTHAAYLGKELEKAELSMKLGFRYLQDSE